MSFEEQTARIERLISLIDSTKTETAVELAKNWVFRAEQFSKTSNTWEGGV